MPDTFSRVARDTLDKVFQKLATDQTAEISSISREIVELPVGRMKVHGLDSGVSEGKRIQGIDFSVDYTRGEENARNLRFRNRVVDFTCSGRDGPVLVDYKIVPRFADAQKIWLSDPDAAVNNLVFNELRKTRIPPARVYLPDELSHPEQIYYFFLAHMRGE